MWPDGQKAKRKNGWVDESGREATMQVTPEIGNERTNRGSRDQRKPAAALLHDARGEEA